MKFSLVNTQTGLAENVLELDTADQMQPPAGYEVIAGGEIGWNWSGSVWSAPVLPEPDSAVVAQLVRAARTRKLKKHVDSMNPMRWESLTTEQQAAWTQYRQDLLNITNQSGFPHVINWPVAPET